MYIHSNEIDDKRGLNIEEIQIILESELKAKGLDYKKVKYCVENAKDFILNDFAKGQDHFTVKKVMDDYIDEYKFRTKGQLLKNIQFYLREGLII